VLDWSAERTGRPAQCGNAAAYADLRCTMARPSPHRGRFAGPKPA
jgi:hypothetical protein